MWQVRAQAVHGALRNYFLFFHFKSIFHGRESQCVWRGARTDGGGVVVPILKLWSRANVLFNIMLYLGLTPIVNAGSLLICLSHLAFGSLTFICRFWCHLQCFCFSAFSVVALRRNDFHCSIWLLAVILCRSSCAFCASDSMVDKNLDPTSKRGHRWFVPLDDGHHQAQRRRLPHGRFQKKKKKINNSHDVRRRGEEGRVVILTIIILM